MKINTIDFEMSAVERAGLEFLAGMVGETIEEYVEKALLFRLGGDEIRHANNGHFFDCCLSYEPS